ncbi:MAG TPA: prephenate dehydrogenase [Thermomicrobiales bacterium]|nr:prephenate dehydrogenase [Thermomicrobiales bacterium]
MQQVTIIGLGLIGGSIGMALRRWSADNENALRIVGYDADLEKQNLAKSKGAIDGAAWNLGEAVKDADIVIVSTPVGAMKELFENIAPSLKWDAIVTDTGSTKTEVLEWAKVLPSTVSFIGGHPMAGKSESLEAATADLFKGATWVVTPSPTASETAIRNVMGLIAAVDAEAFFADPVEHDAYVGGISHLPMVAAAALVLTATGDNSWRDMRTMASTGFRDTTRLALGSPEMHRDISLTNRQSLTRWIDQYIAALEGFKADLAIEDEESARDKVHEFFVKAQDARARAESPARRDEDFQGQDSLKGETVSQSVGRMFLGGFARKDRRKDSNGRR